MTCVTVAVKFQSTGTICKFLSPNTVCLTGGHDEEYLGAVWSTAKPDGVLPDKEERLWVHTNASDVGEAVDCYHKVARR